MKKFLLIFIALTFCLLATAQTQQGFVKTKGRMVNGKLVPGHGLKGTTVSIKGRTAVLVNTDDGAFSFPVTETQFRLDSVHKKGYQLGEGLWIRGPKSHQGPRHHRFHHGERKKR